MLQTVAIGPDQSDARLSHQGLMSALEMDAAGDGPTEQDPESGFCLQIHARLKRVGGESKLLVNDQVTERLAGQPSRALVEALAQAHAWNKATHADPTLTATAIARDVGLSIRYVARIMRLAYLAPDITQSILDGTQPRSWSLRKMLTRIPLSWAEQRTAYGFASK